MKMVKVSNWDKFVLLLWKNWTLQWSHKVQLLVELLLPAVFSLLMVLVRTIVVPEQTPETTYPALQIDNLTLLRSELNNTKTNLSWTIAYTPNNPILETLVSNAAESLNLKYKSVENSDDLVSNVTNNNYLAGIEFDESLASLKNISNFTQFHYALRFPSELRTSKSQLQVTWATNKLFPAYDVTGPRNRIDADGGIPAGYLREGFLPLQHAITTAYLKLVGGVDELPTVDMQRYPYPAYIFDPLLEGLSGIMALIVLLSFIYPSTCITRYITTEKEKQLKEVMKIMGLDNWLHWTAWFVKSFSMFGISALLISIFMKIKWIDDVSVLTYSNWSVLFVFLIVYVITTICFCFMLATFFSKASTAAAVTGLVMFIAFVPFSFLGGSYEELTLSTKLGWCLILNTAMGFGFKVITDFEGTGEGIQWSNLFTPVSVDDDLTLGAIMLVMLASCVLYMLICLYVEQIFPGDFGVPKKWNFPLTKKFWCGESEYIGVEDISANGHLENHSPDAFEVEPIGKHVGVQVRNLKKKFGDKMVVKGVSINMYEDEITVLLGHNGAGKTTTISMLTGMFPPTAGTAIINGSDIRTNIEGARMSLGICPQHNVLFDDMTVANHLVFFSRLKGLKNAAIKREVDKYLKMIQLENKANVMSSKLSGGMKRKLSVCCALTGDTKVVLCDEPSSGLDPAARRQLWDLLQAEKIGRTLLLTTHFMDEADVLGDRIAIMCDGELKCHGTSFFLKKKYGSGYHLICVKRDNCNSEEVTELLRKYIPNITPESEIGSELSYQLPDKYAYVFEEMFGSLEENSTNLNLNGYGVGITSLEEVFMKVGSENAVDGTRKSQNVVMNGGTGYGDEDVESEQSDNIFSESTRLLKGSNLFMNQWQAMILKKLLYTWRNKLLFVIQNIMPIFFVIVTILVARNQGGFNTLPPMTIDLEQYPQVVTVLNINSSVEANSLEYKIAKQYEAIATSYGGDHLFQTTGAQTFPEYILELGKTLQVRINSRYIAAATVSAGRITAWLNNQPLHTAPLTVNLVYNAMAKVLIGPTAEIVVTNSPLPYTIKTLQAQLDTGNNLGTQLATNLCFCMCFVSAFYILFLIKERESRSKLLQFVGGVRVWTFWLTQLLWDMLTYTLTSLIVIITLICFQESGFSTVSELGRYFLIMFIFGFSVLPFTYLASFLFTEPAVGFGRISIINIFLGLALFIVIMVMSFPFYDTKATADALQWFFRVFPHFSLAMGLNKLYTNTATQNICTTFSNQVPEFLLCSYLPKCCQPVSYFGWTDPGILPEIVYLCGTAVLFFFVLVVREYGFINELIYFIRKKAFKPPPPPEEDYLDDDVVNERQRILGMSQNEIAGQNLVLDRVTKYYNKFVAVNQISLGVKQAECFGLLGVNGAGKTSTFKMLTGDERITFGSAYVRGMSLSSDMNDIYKDIGYCPQFDALLDDLTGREMLKIFCLLRGVNKMRINLISEELAKSFGFMKHIDKPTKAYSGGNKRKLSAAIAVIGNPSVIYLDEPTTGIDPAARRQLWNMLCRIRDSGKSIVLTSHSMEECEALCTRLAVMVNGEFKCIGSTQHLKNKFSKGLILKIKVRRNLDLVKQMRNSLSLKDDERSVPTQLLERDITTVKEFVDKEFPQAILQEEYQGILTFYIPLSGIKWSTIFGLLEHNRDELNIEDYSISQTTLEEIFLEFAKYQREDARLFK